MSRILEDMNKRTADFVVLGSLGTFLALSFLIWQNTLQPFDIQLLSGVQSLVPRLADPLLSVLSLLGSFEILTTVLVLVTFFNAPKRLLPILGFYGIGLVIEILGKTYLPHLGPPVSAQRYDLGFLFPSSLYQPGSSFPSGHAFRTTYICIIGLFMAASQTLSKQTKHILSGGVLMFFLLMILSRVSLGEHWPSDVLGGTLLGLGLGLLAIRCGVVLKITEARKVLKRRNNPRGK